MATNLNLDDDLIDQALQLGGHASKRDAVNQALREYIDYMRRLKSIDHFGTIDFDSDYDYKRARQDRRSA